MRVDERGPVQFRRRKKQLVSGKFDWDLLRERLGACSLTLPFQKMAENLNMKNFKKLAHLVSFLN